jgi:hypothetical protein
MALLYIDSFDHYDKPHLLSKWTGAISTYEIAVGKGRCGSNALYMLNSCDVVKGVPFGSATGTVGVAYQIDGTRSLTGLDIEFLRFGNASSYHVYFTRHSDGSISGRRDHAAAGDPILAQTPPDVVRMDRWYFLECQVTIGGVGVGAVTIRVNNVTVAAATGVDTIGRDATGGVTTPELRRIIFDCASNQAYWADDLYILDSTGPAPQNTFLGDCRVEYLRPNGNGAAQGWGVVGASSHWVAVDDGAVPDDDATYLSTVTAGATDTEQYTNTNLPAGPIFGAQVGLHARKTDSGPRQLAPVIRHGGVEYVGNSQGPSANEYHYLLQVYPTNPGTGLPWTISDVNNAEFGVKVTE